MASGSNDATDSRAQPEVDGLVACPLCHTPGPLIQAAIDAGGRWQCRRCGQRCDGRRLAAVAAYAAWAREYDKATRATARLAG
jgi:hypothetical protein